jgi:ADP-heptose:LPS heptosyltransferase
MEIGINQEVGDKSPHQQITKGINLFFTAINKLCDIKNFISKLQMQGVDLVLTVQEGFTANWAAKAGVPPGKKSLFATQAPTGREKPNPTKISG